MVYFVSAYGVKLYTRVQKSVDGMIRVVREDSQGIRVIKALSKVKAEHRVDLIVAGSQKDGRLFGVAPSCLAQQVKARTVGQADIEQQQVKPGRQRGAGRGQAAGVGHGVALLRQGILQALHYRGVVLHKQQPQRRGWSGHGEASFGFEIRVLTLTIIPPSPAPRVTGLSQKTNKNPTAALSVTGWGAGRP